MEARAQRQSTSGSRRGRCGGRWTSSGAGTWTTRAGSCGCPRSGPNPLLEKLLNSAVANAEQRAAIAENLFVARAWVDEGPTLKRWRPRAYGRATQIRKRTSHVTVVVESLEKVGEVSGGTQG